MTIKLLKSKKVNFYKIEQCKNNILITIERKDLGKVAKLFKVSIKREFGLVAILKYICSNRRELEIVLGVLAVIFFYTHLIIRVTVTTTDTELRKIVENELDRADIKPFMFRKRDKQIKEITEQILENQKDYLEWLSIEEYGMTLRVLIEEKVKENIVDEPEYCNIIAKKDGTVTRIISSRGQEMVEVNMHVHEGDILISGDVLYNNEIKDRVCSKGEVYAKTWYNLNFSIPLTHESVEETGKKRINIWYFFDNQKKKLRKDKYKDEQVEVIWEFSFLGRKVQFVREKEVERKEESYNNVSLEAYVNKEVAKKMESVLQGKGKVLEQKVLKKVENNSKIDMVVFVVAEEQIGITSYS